MSIFTIHTNRIPQWGTEVRSALKGLFFNDISFRREQVSWKELILHTQKFVKLEGDYFTSTADGSINIFVFTHAASLVHYLRLACSKILPCFSSSFSPASSQQIMLSGFDWSIMDDCWVENEGSFSKVYHGSKNSSLRVSGSLKHRRGVSGDFAGLLL